MSDIKTKMKEVSVKDFINAIEDIQKKKDCKKLLSLMKSISKKNPKMWGESIVGFGSYHYKYASGREGDWFITGFAPRKTNMTIYVMSGFGEVSLMKKLGKFKTGKSCLYVKHLHDIDIEILKKLISLSIEKIKTMEKKMNS